MKIKQISLEGARIVKFEPKYAASVADMWNASAEGWNGESWNGTEQLVLNEELSSDYIGSYLVIDEKEKVLGYCKLEEYRDKKAVYIALLNVIPLYWGKKYGKALILKSFQETIRLSYPRLDLHSWSGNTKAVPLYKRTGFRWQSSNSSMYMMNFVPYLLSLEILSPFLEKLDWYDDCVCDLSLEPDSKMERGFEFFDYNWKKGDLYLEAVFNADAKGLCYLNCNDFEIKLSAPQYKTCYGSREVYLEITSKTAKPLTIDMTMESEAEIDINETRSFTVTDNTRETFKIQVRDDIESGAEEIPSVTAKMSVNGFPLQMKLGLKPQAPVSVMLMHNDIEVYQPGDIELYLQFKNNLKETAQVNLTLPDIDELSFQKSAFTVELQAEEKKTVKVPASFKKGCFYDQEIKVQLQNGDETVSYSQKLKLEIADIDTPIYGETKDYWFMRKGSLQLIYAKEATRHPLYLNVNEKNYWFYMMPPKLSEPFDKEFVNQVAESADFSQADDGVQMRVHYKSKNHKFQVNSIIKMRNDKVIEHDWRIENLTAKPLTVDFLESDFDSAATQAIYDGRLLDMTLKEKNNTWRRLPAEKITSGWMFYDEAGFTAAISWNKENKFGFGEWWQIVKYDVGTLQPGEMKSIKGEKLLLNTFKNWHDFYWWKYRSRNYPDIMRVREIVINERNPFCDNEISFKYIDLSDGVEEKKLKVYGDDGLLKSDDYISGEWQKTFTRNAKFKLEIEEEAKNYSFEQITFANCRQPMHFSNIEQAGKTIIVLQGEQLELKAAEEFMVGIFSLKYKGKELLSSSFPHSITRGWSNHWHGGIEMTPHRISASLLKKQKAVLKQEIRHDNFGNVWQGFSFTVKYDDNIPNLQDITIRYNYLVSPSQDIIAVFNEVIDTGGAYRRIFRASANIYINEDQPVNIYCKNNTLKVAERCAGDGEQKLINVELLDTNCFLNFFSPINTLDAVVFKKMGEISYQYIITGIEPGMVKASQPLYLHLSDRKMTIDELQVLNRIKWS